MANENYGIEISIKGQSEKDIKRIEAALKGLNEEVKHTSSTFMDTFKGMAAAAGLEGLISKVREGIGEFFRFGSQMEQTRLSFEVLLQSAEKGRKMAADLKAYADVTPFDSKQIYESAKQLMSFGVTEREVLPSLKMLGDVSGGVAEKFQRLTYAFGQAKATGRLTGRELMEFTMAGFNPLQELQKVDLSQFQNKQLKSLDAQIDKLKQTKLLNASMRQTRGGGTSSGEIALQIDNLKRQKDALKASESPVEALRRQIAKGEISFEMLNVAFQKATSEGGRFYKMTEKGAQTVGGLASTLRDRVQGVVMGLFDRMSPTIRNIEKDLISVGSVLQNTFSLKDSEIIKTEKDEMNVLFGVLEHSNISTDQRKSLIDKLNLAYKDYLPNLLSESDSLDEITKKQNLANKALRNNIDYKVEKEREKELQKNLEDANNQLSQLQETQSRLNLNIPISTYDKLKLAFKAMVASGHFLNLGLDVGVSKSNTEAIVQKQINDTWIKAKMDIKKAKKELEEFQKKEGFNPEDFAFGTDPYKLSPDELEKGKKQLTNNVTQTIDLANHGGLGSAKIIHMNFNKPLFQVDCKELSSNDINADAQKTVEIITRALTDIAANQGIT